MSRAVLKFDAKHPLVVGSFGNAASLQTAEAGAVREACDVVEIRLDLLEAEGVDCSREIAALAEEKIPLLFTARRRSEGGAGDLDAARRSGLVEMWLEHAAVVDVEWESRGEMSELLETLRARGIPWVASWHDFEGDPGSWELVPVLAARAAEAGAACFKAAIRMHQPKELTALAECLHRGPNSPALPLPLSLMGMGPLAPVSRLLAGQCGSVLNYGYVGDAPTAPGQWSARQLREGIRGLEGI